MKYIVLLLSFGSVSSYVMGKISKTFVSKTIFKELNDDKVSAARELHSLAPTLPNGIIAIEFPNGTGVDNFKQSIEDLSKTYGEIPVEIVGDLEKSELWNKYKPKDSNSEEAEALRKKEEAEELRKKEEAEALRKKEEEEISQNTPKKK